MTDNEADSGPSDSGPTVPGPADAASGEVRPTRSKQASETRQRLLDAAIRVIQRDGAATLTLDKVAAEASVSKGGLLHHFATKDDLIVSLLNNTLSAAGQELERRSDKYEGKNGAFASAYLDYVSDPYVEATTYASSILAAAALDDTMLGDARATFHGWQQRLLEEDGLSELTALLARIIGDGLWLIDLFELAPPSASQRAIVVDFVQSRIDAERHRAGRDDPGRQDTDLAD